MGEGDKRGKEEEEEEEEEEGLGGDEEERGGRLRRGSGQSAWNYPRAQSAWDYPQGSRLFAHATDTDDAVTPPTAVSDCLGARAAKNR